MHFRSGENGKLRLWVFPIFRGFVKINHPGSPVWPNELPHGRIGNPESMDHPKNHSLFGRLDFQGSVNLQWKSSGAKWSEKNMRLLSHAVTEIGKIFTLINIPFLKHCFVLFNIFTYPIGSRYGKFTYIGLICLVNALPTILYMYQRIMSKLSQRPRQLSTQLPPPPKLVLLWHKWSFA